MWGKGPREIPGYIKIFLHRMEIAFTRKSYLVSIKKESQGENCVVYRWALSKSDRGNWMFVDFSLCALEGFGADFAAGLPF